VRSDVRGTRPTHRPAPAAALTTAALTVAVLFGSAAPPASAVPTTARTSNDDAPAGGYVWPGIDALELGEPAQEDLVASVTEYVVEPVTRYVVEGSVDTVDDTTQDGAETVVSLSSDILFDTDDASLSRTAKAKVGGLVEEVPSGATVKVYGHTDSVDTDAHNQDLSQRRAQAVAAAVRAARGDLKLDVRGFGETQLKEPETGDEAAVADARSENRRVEIRYGG
jgi:outer membrane protein OmpA-like peptidoglycan-associated protein